MTKKKKKNGKKQNNRGLEYEIMKIMEKSLKIAINAALDDILKD